MTFRGVLFLSAALVSPVSTLAHETHRHDHSANVHSHDPHVHGEAALGIAIDGVVVTIEYRSPLWNLLGFERAPETEVEQAAAEEARKTLADPGALFDFGERAGCSPVETRVNLLGEEEDDGDHEEGHSHRHYGPHAGVEDGHFDASATYVFTCADPDRIGRVATALFARFPKLERLKVTGLAETRQVSGELTRRRPWVALR